MLTLATALALFGATCFVALAASTASSPVRTHAARPAARRVTVLSDERGGQVAPRVSLRSGQRPALCVADPALWQLLSQTERALVLRQVRAEL